MIHPESPHQHPHTQTGRRWLDLLVAFSALAISAVSIVVAVHHGETMEKLVEADTWPYLSLDSSNIGPQGQSEVIITLRNSGAGPLKVKAFSLTYEDQIYRRWPDLLRACCAPDGVSLETDEALLAAVGEELATGSPNHRVLIPGDEQLVLSLRREAVNDAVWRKLDLARHSFGYKACYCSVFDECYETTLNSTETVHVEQCELEPNPWNG